MRLAGFTGFLVCLDELVNLYKLSNTQARNANYEQILRILNDCLQGSAAGLGIILGGTPDFLFGHAAGPVTPTPPCSPAWRRTPSPPTGWSTTRGRCCGWQNLSPEDLYVLLLNKLRHVCVRQSSRYLVPDDALTSFMSHCSNRVGDAYFRTPRTTIKEFVNLLAVLEQNPGIDWSALIERVELAPRRTPDLVPLADEPRLRHGTGRGSAAAAGAGRGR